VEIAAMRFGSSRRALTLASVRALLPLAPRSAYGDGDAGYELPAPVATADIVRPEVLAGPRHKVRPTATPVDFLYLIELESEYGLFKVEGRRRGAECAKEVETMAKLLAMDGGGEFMKSLGGRVSALPTAAVHLVTDPKGSVEAMGKGVERTLGRVGDLFGGRKKLDPERGGGGDARFGQEMRKLAYEFDVDPYSSNTKLQTLLDEVARARGAGRLGLDAASFAVTGGARVALSVVKMRDDVKGLRRDHTPAELDRQNDKKRAKRGVPSSLRREFGAHRSLSPTHRTAITTAVGRLEGVADAGPVVAAALTAEDEPSAVVRVQQARLLAHHHEARERLRVLDVVGGVVVGFTASGGVVVYTAVDGVPWTAGTEGRTRAILAVEGVATAPSRDLYATGLVTPRAVEALGRLGFAVQSGYVPR